MVKKIAALCLVVCMLFSGIVVSASEESATPQAFSPDDFAGFAATKNGGIMLLDLDTPTIDELCQQILEFNTVTVNLGGVLTEAAPIYVYDLGIPADAKGENVSRFVSTLVQHCPELFVCKENFAYGSSNDGYIHTVYALFKYDIDECKQKIAEFNDILDNILKDLPDNATDLEKVMFIHDYLALHGKYDFSLEISDAYRFLTEGTGVCQGYALSFCALARKAGLNCIQASSQAQNHIWNLVEVDGEWYHVDVTWDDPANNYNIERVGHVSYKHFLKSTDKILEVTFDEETGSSREDWQIVGDMQVVCDSDRFDSGYAWDDDEWPFVKLGNDWYGIKFINRHITLNKISNDFTSYTEIGDIGEIFWSTGQGWWKDAYCGFYAIGNSLYFNTPNSLEKISFNNGAFKAEIIDISKLTGETNLSIYGSYYDKAAGQIVFQYQTSPNDATHTDYAVNIQHLSDLDASCAQLLIKVRRFLMRTGELEAKELFDVNGDGEVNIVDLVRMKKRSAA